MTRDFDRVGQLPWRAQSTAAAAATIEAVLSALRGPGVKPPLPPTHLTADDRLLGEPVAG